MLSSAELLLAEVAGKLADLEVHCFVVPVVLRLALSAELLGTLRTLDSDVVSGLYSVD